MATPHLLIWARTVGLASLNPIQRWQKQKQTGLKPCKPFLHGERALPIGHFWQSTKPFTKITKNRKRKKHHERQNQTND